MTKRTWLLGLMSLIVFGACLAMPFVPLSIQPYDLVPLFQQKAAQVAPSSLGLPMPKGLQPGDVIYLQDNAPTVRLAFLIGVGNMAAGSKLTLHIRRDGVLQAAEVEVVPLNLEGLALVNQIASYALMVLISALGLLVLWRGQGLATLGVALWCFTSALNDVFRTLPLGFEAATLFGFVGLIVSTVGTLIGLYLIAEELTAGAGAERWQRRMRLIFWSVFAVYLADVAVQDAHLSLTGDPNIWAIFSFILLHVVVFIIPLWMLVRGRRGASPVNQARIRWILFGLGALLIAYLLPFFSGAFTLAPAVSGLLLTALTTAAYTCFAYAVLRHRLVSLELVLNRTLVYGLITSLVVGVFAAVLAFLERRALDTETNRFLALLIPLLLGMGLNAIKQKVDFYINRHLFRKRHRAAAALEQFARTCGFVEDPERLLDLAAEELHAQSGAQGVAVYLAQAGKEGAKLARQKGTLRFPPKLAADDQVILRLRAGDAEVDLHGTRSALGTEGHAYGLMVRGEVLGFVLCGPRPAETYSLEERRLFAHVAHHLAVALHALQLQEQQQLLRDIASGAVKTPPSVRAKANALIAPRAAG
ncbi:MAG: GAF domain-containing protein [Bacillota bacterium]